MEDGKRADADVGADCDLTFAGRMLSRSRIGGERWRHRIVLSGEQRFPAELHVRMRYRCK